MHITVSDHQPSEIILAQFTGCLTQALLVEFAETLRAALLAHRIENKIIEKCFLISIEMGQNILKYSSPYQQQSFFFEKYCSLIITLSNEQLLITTKNGVTERNQLEISTAISHINSLTLELKNQLFKKVLRRKKENDIEKKGAGLGFIEIGRKSNNPIKVQFNSENTNLCVTLTSELNLCPKK